MLEYWTVKQRQENLIANLAQSSQVWEGLCSSASSCVISPQQFSTAKKKKMATYTKTRSPDPKMLSQYQVAAHSSQRDRILTLSGLAWAWTSTLNHKNLPGSVRGVPWLRSWDTGGDSACLKLILLALHCMDAGTRRQTSSPLLLTAWCFCQISYLTSGGSRQPTWLSRGTEKKISLHTVWCQPHVADDSN